MTKTLREARAQQIKDAQALLAKPDATAEDLANATRMMDESDALLSRIEAMERVEALALTAGINAALVSQAQTTAARMPHNAASEQRVFNALVNQGARLDRLPQADQDYFRESTARELRIIRALSLGNTHTLDDDDRTHLAARFGTGAIRAAGATVPDTAGGYTIAPLFEAVMLVAMKAQGGMRSVARVIQTATGAALPYPTMDDTAQKATILGTENTDVGTGTDLTFGRRQLGAHTYVSGMIPVSLLLLQDTAFDFESLLRDALAGRFVRGQNEHFTVGTGVNQPRGVVTAATSGATAATAGGLVVTYADLIELEHSVNPVYRTNARWMFHDTTLKALRKLVDTTGRPLWEPSLTADTPELLLRRPFVINQDMAVPALNAVTVAFGDFTNYVIRDTLGLQIAVLRERYAEKMQVAWSAYMRSDGDLLSAAQPIKTLVMPAV